MPLGRKDAHDDDLTNTFWIAAAAVFAAAPKSWFAGPDDRLGPNRWISFRGTGKTAFLVTHVGGHRFGNRSITGWEGIGCVDSLSLNPAC